MDGLQIDMLKIKIYSIGNKILRNKAVSVLALLMLSTAVFFITIHPRSVWYYFASGFFLCRIIGLSFQKFDLGLQLENTVAQFKKIMAI